MPVTKSMPNNNVSAPKTMAAAVLSFTRLATLKTKPIPATVACPRVERQS
jgi:hypothetical protein